jgi:hypothetical protein
MSPAPAGEIVIARYYERESGGERCRFKALPEGGAKTG